ncbi:MAG: hypothetical protein GF383_04435 [Candidatus Lokiarchaeota archaeon]|nr:hypothetical protein [Candidatus Lokiarchaeota archaeon]MBD3339037.1 hypothetical protein [Candidatus Lokiarchaeota archaeon]
MKKNDFYLNHPIEIIPLTVSDLNQFGTLFYDIALDGIILYDKNKIGFKFLTKYKEKIKEKGLKRVYLGENDFYWKRKDIEFGEIVEL